MDRSSKFTNLAQAPAKHKTVVGKYAKKHVKILQVFLLLFSGCDRE